MKDTLIKSPTKVRRLPDANFIVELLIEDSHDVFNSMETILVSGFKCPLPGEHYMYLNDKGTFEGEFFIRNY